MDYMTMKGCQTENSSSSLVKETEIPNLNR